jgi:tetratricopeptide (TPR) repeat protein
MSDPSRDLMRAIRRAANDVDAAFAEAIELVDDLLAQPPDSWRAVVAKNRSYHAAPVVTCLVERARAFYHELPWRTFELAMLAVEVGSALPDSEESWRVRASAGRALCLGHVGIGELQQALGALAVADSCVGDWPDSDLELARIAYARGSVLRRMSRTLEAREALATAARVFRKYGETKLVAEVRYNEASIEFSAANYGAALSIFTSIVDEMHNLGDVENEAGALFNMGQCLYRTGAHAEAIVTWREAGELFRRANMPADLVRMNWNVGRIQVAAGAVIEGIAEMMAAEVEFGDLRMTGEVVSVGLEIVEAMITAEVDLDDAMRRAVRLVETAQLAGMDQESQMALAYLRQAAIAREVTPEFVRDVRLFITDRKAYPGRKFAPPRGRDLAR